MHVYVTLKQEILVHNIDIRSWVALFHYCLCSYRVIPLYLQKRACLPFFVSSYVIKYGNKHLKTSSETLNRVSENII